MLIIGGSISIFGQSEPKKFDEFDVNESTHYYPYDRINVLQRIRRLENYVRKRKNVAVFVVSYKARKSTYESRMLLDNLAGEARSTIAYQTGVGDKNVRLLEGGYRDTEMIEFWIGPRNSKPPPFTPKYMDDVKFECVDINLGEKGMNFDVNESATFSAWTYPKQNFSFIWTPSIGEVIDGQGTESVRIDTKGQSKLTLFVEVKGLPEPCEKVAFKTFEIGRRPFLADKVTRYMYSDLAARVDNFMIMLNANPQLTGCIIAYSGRGENDSIEQDRALASIKRIFVFRRFSADRVKIINGGSREYNSAEMWLLPPGVEPPKPTPSVDSRFIKVTKRRVNFDQ